MCFPIQGNTSLVRVLCDGNTNQVDGVAILDQTWNKLLSEKKFEKEISQFVGMMYDCG